MAMMGGTSQSPGAGSARRAPPPFPPKPRAHWSGQTSITRRRARLDDARVNPGVRAPPPPPIGGASRRSGPRGQPMAQPRPPAPDAHWPGMGWRPSTPPPTAPPYWTGLVRRHATGAGTGRAVKRERSPPPLAGRGWRARGLGPLIGRRRSMTGSHWRRPTSVNGEEGVKK
ncbi:hypothetical protein chiPu_0028815 [Chiloscyllium punctatum]|uniref:Uncharacterized protein n=1 Tax=Chiloscyllium punctatum TaxID=137246 RepID=A0A401TQV8_CHIPU|nr:hypothetical protein [Chiloscyllium punctatum]